MPDERSKILPLLEWAFTAGVAGFIFFIAGIALGTLNQDALGGSIKWIHGAVGVFTGGGYSWFLFSFVILGRYYVKKMFTISALVFFIGALILIILYFLADASIIQMEPLLLNVSFIITGVTSLIFGFALRTMRTDFGDLGMIISYIEIVAGLLMVTVYLGTIGAFPSLAGDILLLVLLHLQIKKLKNLVQPEE